MGGNGMFRSLCAFRTALRLPTLGGVSTAVWHGCVIMQGSASPLEMPPPMSLLSSLSSLFQRSRQERVENALPSVMERTAHLSAEAEMLKAQAAMVSAQAERTSAITQAVRTGVGVVSKAVIVLLTVLTALGIIDLELSATLVDLLSHVTQVISE